MSVEMTAAIYGAISGAIVAGLINVLILVARYYLRRWGGIEFTPSNWRFTYLAFPIYEHFQTPDGSTYSKPAYRFYEPDGHNDYDPKEANYAIYGFTADILNKMGVADTLSDVSVTFMKDGTEVFAHQPFDQDNTIDHTPVVLELPPTKLNYELPEEFFPPGQGVESIGTVSLPAHDSKRIRLKGYVSGSDVLYLHGGCDEVRLHATRLNGKVFDERIALQKTARQPRSTGGGSVGMIGL